MAAVARYAAHSAAKTFKFTVSFERYTIARRVPLSFRDYRAGKTCLAKRNCERDTTGRAALRPLEHNERIFRAVSRGSTRGPLFHLHSEPGPNLIIDGTLTNRRNRACARRQVERFTVRFRNFDRRRKESFKHITNR